jgi:hypothetical protein
MRMSVEIANRDHTNVDRKTKVFLLIVQLVLNMSNPAAVALKAGSGVAVEIVGCAGISFQPEEGATEKTQICILFPASSWR